MHGSYIQVYVGGKQDKYSIKVRSSRGLQPQGGGEAGDEKGCSEKVRLREDLKEGGVQSRRISECRSFHAEAPACAKALRQESSKLPRNRKQISLHRDYIRTTAALISA